MGELSSISRLSFPTVLCSSVMVELGEFLSTQQHGCLQSHSQAFLGSPRTWLHEEGLLEQASGSKYTRTSVTGPAALLQLPSLSLGCLFLHPLVPGFTFIGVKPPLRNPLPPLSLPSGGAKFPVVPFALRIPELGASLTVFFHQASK